MRVRGHAGGGGGAGPAFGPAPFLLGGVGAAKGLLPCFLVPKRNQPTACTLALWWLKFGPTEASGGGGGRLQGVENDTQPGVSDIAYFQRYRDIGMPSFVRKGQDLHQYLHPTAWGLQPPQPQFQEQWIPQSTEIGPLPCKALGNMHHETPHTNHSKEVGPTPPPLRPPDQTTGGRQPVVPER